jgi:polyisoprenoid-binding protein YceI
MKKLFKSQISTLIQNRKNIFFVTVITNLILLTLPAHTFAQTKQQVSSSKITFKIKNAGIYVDGTLSGLEADIQFDGKNLKNSKMVASVKTSTINTENNGRDKHLKADDYFDVAKYPKITFATSNFAESQSGNFIGYFDVTIKDKTKKVTIPFTFKNNTFSGNFTINRLDFGVGSSSIVLGNEVKVNLEIVVQ